MISQNSPADLDGENTSEAALRVLVPASPARRTPCTRGGAVRPTVRGSRSPSQAVSSAKVLNWRLRVLHMKLCASRAFWLVAYPSPGQEMLFDAHTRSFAALCGIPRRGHSSHDVVAVMMMLNDAVLSITDHLHLSRQWLRFLKLIDRRTPNSKELHPVVNNYATH